MALLCLLAFMVPIFHGIKLQAQARPLVAAQLISAENEHLKVQIQAAKVAYHQLQEETQKLAERAALPTPEKMALLIRHYFPDDYKTALMVFKDESGLFPDRMNWNCTYTENGKQISKACNKEDRGRAWSVDCGLTQLNFLGKVCPKEAFEPEWNLQHAKEKFDRRGFQPWVTFNTQRYLRNEEWAKEYLAKGNL